MAKSEIVSFQLTGEACDAFARKVSRIPGMSPGQVARKCVIEWLNADDKTAASRDLAGLVSQVDVVIKTIPEAIRSTVSASVTEAIQATKDAQDAESQKMLAAMRLEIAGLKGVVDAQTERQAETNKLLLVISKRFAEVLS
jgi:hypothetical protein